MNLKNVKTEDLLAELASRPEVEHKAARAELAELEKLALPIVEWIRDHHDPHTEVHISWDHAWVRQDLLSLPFPYSEGVREDMKTNQMPWEEYLASMLTDQQIKDLREALRHNREIKISGPQRPTGKSLLCENLCRAEFRAHEAYEEFPLVMDLRPGLKNKEELLFHPETIRSWVESGTSAM